MQHQCTAALVKAEQLSHCSVLLCKTGSQQPCATAITPMEICSSYRCAMMQHQCTAALVKAEQLPHCSVLLCKTGSQQPCATAITPMEICSSYRCAVMQHQCTAALVRAEQLPHFQCCSVKQAYSSLVSLQIHLYRFVCTMMQHQCTAALVRAEAFLLFFSPTVQCSSCSDATPMHCKGRTARLFSAALQNSSLVPPQIHLWRFALHTGVQ